jgi:hypothetical protein
LARQNEREDLLKKIRLVHGTCQNIGHEWIEFEEDGKSIPFESTIEIPFMTANDLEYFKKLYKEEICNSSDRIVYGKALNGNRFYMPTFRGLIGLGLVQTIMRTRKYLKNEKNSQKPTQ